MPKTRRKAARKNVSRPSTPPPPAPSRDDAPESPSMFPTAEECKYRIRYHIERSGFEPVRVSPNFISRICYLRFILDDLSCIPYQDFEGRQWYLYPCQSRLLRDESCETFRISATNDSPTMFCCDCQDKLDEEERLRNLTLEEMMLTPAEKLSTDQVLQVCAEERRIFENFKKQQLIENENEEAESNLGSP